MVGEKAESVLPERKRLQLEQERRWKQSQQGQEEIVPAVGEET